MSVNRPSGQNPGRAYIVSRFIVAPMSLLLPCLIMRTLPASSLTTRARASEVSISSRLSWSTANGPSRTMRRSARISKALSLHLVIRGSSRTPPLDCVLEFGQPEAVTDYQLRLAPALPDCFPNLYHRLHTETLGNVELSEVIELGVGGRPLLHWCAPQESEP